MLFDELGVDARDVHLAQVDARAGVLDAPGDDGEQRFPLFGELNGLQRALLDPG